LARQNARSDRVCLDFSLLLSLHQGKESKYELLREKVHKEMSRQRK